MIPSSECSLQIIRNTLEKSFPTWTFFSAKTGLRTDWSHRHNNDAKTDEMDDTCINLRLLWIDCNEISTSDLT